MGAFVSPAHKFFWWGVGVALLLVLIYILIAELSKAVDDGRCAPPTFCPVLRCTGRIPPAICRHCAPWLTGRCAAACRVNEHDGVTLRILTYLTCFSLAFFPVLWLVGQEGSASASLTLEVALSAVADVLAKVAFAVTLIVRLEVDGTTYRSQGGKMGSVAAGRVVDSTYV